MKKLSYREWVMFSIILVILVATTVFYASNSTGIGFSTTSKEIKEILALKATPERSDVLLRLLDRVGPAEAQEQLVRSGLPFTGESHLLVHTVGDYVYSNYGLAGLQYCKDYFLSACYHGFIINSLADYGIDGVAEAIENCKEAPPGVAAQCAHASGHGFVAWHDYDLVKGAEMCDKLGTEVENFAYFNCYDGVFMENVWGVHDGELSDKRWVSDTDIYYPCTDSRIPEKYLGGCWSNQATLMFQHFKGDLSKTAIACDGVESTDYRDICYNNLYRQIHPMTDGKIEMVFSMCSVATGKNRQDECVLTNMVSYWSVGDRQIPFKICNAVDNSIKEDCFNRLLGMVNFSYNGNPEEKKVYCDKISSNIHRNRCLGTNI